MGDSLGDVLMAGGIPNPNVILKIGFKQEHGGESYKYKVGAEWVTLWWTCTWLRASPTPMSSSRLGSSTGTPRRITSNIRWGVLMGDSLGDLHIAEGIPNPNVILKIGFLNKNTEENLTKYKVHADG
jgi:hypothetical protein